MHFESTALREGSIGRLRCPPGTVLRLPNDLARASPQGLYVLYVLGGDLDVTHVGDRSVAKGGNIVTFDGATSAGIRANGRGPHDIVTLEIPAARLWALRPPFAASSGPRLMRETVTSPLAACMKLAAERMHAASKQELTALYEACVSLLIAAESRSQSAATPQPATVVDNPLLRNILDYTNLNICDRTLGPPHVAHRFGISVRYLHKLFAGVGLTFATYVAKRRLEHVHNALVSDNGDAQSITELAHKWGFGDISAFNKAFRKRFGCAPRRLRSRTVF